MYEIPRGVSVLSFDIWNTLLRGNQAFTRPRLALIFSHLKLGYLKADDVLDAYLLANRFLNEESERNGIDYGMGERLAIMYDRLGLEHDVPDDATILEIQERTGKLRRNPEYLPTLTEPDLLATLTALREQGYLLGLLSNTGMDNHLSMEPLLKLMGLWQLFDNAIFSSQDGRAKPNEGIFLRMATEFKVEPDQVLHIGDNRTADYNGARAAGMHGVLYAPNTARKPNQIKSMKELLRQ